MIQTWVHHQIHGMPIIWKLQLQTEIALSSMESQYMGLSYALREHHQALEGEAKT